MGLAGRNRYGRRQTCHVDTVIREKLEMRPANHHTHTVTKVSSPGKGGIVAGKKPDPGGGDLRILGVPLQPCNHWFMHIKWNRTSSRWLLLHVLHRIGPHTVSGLYLRPG